MQVSYIMINLLHSWCELFLPALQLIYVIDEYVQASGVFVSPAIHVIGGDDHPVASDWDVDWTEGACSGLPQIFAKEVDPIVYDRYVGHVRDAIRISRQGYWSSDIPSPFRIESRTARHGDTWRTRSFTKVEIEYGAVWIVL